MMYGPIVSRVPDTEPEAKLTYIHYDTRTTNALILITGDTCLSFERVRNGYNTSRRDNNNIKSDDGGGFRRSLECADYSKFIIARNHIIYYNVEPAVLAAAL